MNRSVIRWICVAAVLIAMLPLNGWSARFTSAGASGTSGQCSVVQDDHAPSCCVQSDRSSTGNTEPEACAWLGAWCNAPGCGGACICCGQPQLIMILAAGPTFADGDQPPPTAVALFPGLASQLMIWRERPHDRFETGPPGIRQHTLLTQRCLLLI